MLYEYECKKCKIIIEEQKKLKDNTDSIECPQCGKEAKKIVSKFGFKINGFSSLNGYSQANR